MRGFSISCLVVAVLSAQSLLHADIVSSGSPAFSFSTISGRIEECKPSTVACCIWLLDIPRPLCRIGALGQTASRPTGLGWPGCCARMAFGAESVSGRGGGIQPMPDGGVRMLPTGPGSDALAMMGFLGMGAFSVLRSARHCHFGHLPDWCHHAGPVQIGHTAVCDFAGPSVGWVTWFSLAESTAGLTSHHTDRLWDLPSWRSSRHLPLLTVPRGPPSRDR